MAIIDGNKKKLNVSGEAIESAVNSKHEHSNSAVLDKLSDNNGTLQYNGADITGGSASEITASKVKMADNTTVEDTVSSLKEDLVNSKKAENITMADGTTIEDNLCNKKDITSSIFIKDVTGIVLYYNKLSNQIDITNSAIASYSCYNVGDKNKLYLTFSTFDRTDKTTAIEYVYFTDDDDENVQHATYIGRAFSDKDDKTAKQYINAEITVPENAKRMYINYVVAEGKPIIRTIDKLDLQKSVNDGENSKKYLKELYASNSAKGMQELDNKLEIYVSNYIAENGKKINGVNKTRAEIKEWILNRDNCIYHGALHKEGTRIVDKNGYPVEIRGIGTHQLLQFTNIQTKKGIETLKYYGVNCLRLTAYLEDAVRVKSNGEMSYGYLNHVEETRARMDELIEWCVELGLYVIVDWHLLATDGLMSRHIDEAKAFFEYFASKYKNCDNVIYEICNEPFGNDETLDTYMPCVKECYNIIRQYNATAIIVTGMKYDWTRDDMLNAFNTNGLTDMFMSNHGYIGKMTDGDWVDEAYRQQVEKYPIFCTEWGNAESTGDGQTNDSLAKRLLNTYHKYCMPHCFWKFTNQNMTCSALKYSDASWYDDMYADGGWTYEDLSHNGKIFLGSFQEYAFGDSYITRGKIVANIGDYKTKGLSIDVTNKKAVLDSTKTKNIGYINIPVKKDTTYNMLINGLHNVFTVGFSESEIENDSIVTIVKDDYSLSSFSYTPAKDGYIIIALTTQGQSTTVTLSY